MWKLEKPEPVKLIIGVLAANAQYLKTAIESLESVFGESELASETWLFDKTDYYKVEMGPLILRQFISFKRLISQRSLAKIKRRTNKIEKKLTQTVGSEFPRPVNLDPGIIEPSKLVLATTKNFSHRIYIGKKMYAEITLIYNRHKWKAFDYTYPDHQQDCYLDFFSKVRTRLKEQLKSKQ